ncbi:acyl-CoA dehydrogenase family protein [Amycolatopsis sp. NPDC059657]|uniref:acyl-CoA dehydrogenase family protein n=1 Tax=Amycolatopsis sp. NPDC059657 TaxID=3346899 RepID=UPI00366B5078
MSFTEEQEALRASVRTALERNPEPWQALCQIGVTALAIPEEYGGLGAGLTELQIVAEELGRVLADVPFLSTVLATQALLSTEDETARKRLLPRLAEGITGALALTGEYVVDGDTAEILLAVKGNTLYEVDSAHTRHTPTMDETRRLASVEIVDAHPVGEVNLNQVRDVALAVLAAEQAGAAARALHITVEFCKRRKQFGRAIGGFQALKHRMADLYVLIETARSAAYAATSERMAAIAKVYCSEAFCAVAAEMIQLHGGIAITWEHEAHRYFKRAHLSAQLFGSPREHLARVGQTPA